MAFQKTNDKNGIKQRREFIKYGIGLGGAVLGSACGGESEGQLASSPPLALTEADHAEVVDAMVARSRLLGVFSVLDFPNVFNTDFQISTGIQAAIDEVASRVRSGILYFPPGEYHVQSTLILPRDRGIRIVGAGVHQTSIGISAAGAATNDPLPLFEIPAAGSTAGFISFEHISLRNRSKGMVLRHTHTATNENAGRLLYFLMSRVGLSAVQAHKDPLLWLEHCHDSSFENLTMDGGAGLYFEVGSRVMLRNVRSTQDGSLANGIIINGGGTFSLYDIRFEGIEGKNIADRGNEPVEGYGHGLWLRGGVGDVSVRTIDFEGKRSRCLVNVEDANGVTLKQLGLASPRHTTTDTSPLVPADYPQFGLRVGANSERVRVEKAYFPHYARYATGDRAGSRCVVIEPGARQVEIVDAIAPYYDPPDIPAELIVPDTIGPFRIQGVILREPTTPLRRFEIVRGVFDATQNTPRLNVQNYSLLRLAGGTVSGIDNGHTGQVVTLLFDAPTVVEPSSELQLATNVSWTAPAGASLQLLFDGARWVEVARMADEAVVDVESWTGTLNVTRGNLFRVSGDRVNVLQGGYQGKQVTLLMAIDIQFQSYVQGTSPPVRGNLIFRTPHEGESWSALPGETITFVRSGESWYEVSRSELARPGSRVVNAFGSIQVSAAWDRYLVGGDHFVNITGGRDGDTITILFTDDVQLVRGGNIRFAAAAGESWTAPAGATMRFLREGGVWHELSRSLNS